MDESLLDQHVLPDPDLPSDTNTLVHPDSVAKQIRINYKSGAFIQTWYSNFDVEYTLSGHIMQITWTLAEVHPSAICQMTSPIEIGINDIESIWVIQTKRAAQLYTESIGAI